MSLPKLGLRSSGLLVHPTSLPGPHGCGDLGVPARLWLDFVERSGHRWWQMLPVGPTGYGNSPYSAQSAFAGSALLLALEPLVEAGWLDERALAAGGELPPGRVDYPATARFREGCLRAALGVLADLGPRDPRWAAFLAF